jgi:hypothetical protein
MPASCRRSGIGAAADSGVIQGRLQCEEAQTVVLMLRARNEADLDARELLAHTVQKPAAAIGFPLVDGAFASMN